MANTFLVPWYEVRVKTVQIIDGVKHYSVVKEADRISLLQNFLKNTAGIFLYDKNNIRLTEDDVNWHNFPEKE